MIITPNLNGKVALVTGGSRGIGAAIAVALGEAGAAVAVNYRERADAADALVADLNKAGKRAIAVAADVSQASHVTKMIERVTSALGPVDILVNNAGIAIVRGVDDLTEDDFDRTITVNLKSTFLCTQAVLAAMRAKKWGRIVNITSIGGVLAVPHLLPYACAKAAAVALSDGLGAELRKDGVVVTTVIPGLMRTGSFPFAFFKGDAPRELAWFRWLSTAPVSAMSVQRAARRIVAAVERGDGQLVLTLSAKVGRLASALMPGVVRRLFMFANRLLSSGARDRNKRERRGRELLGAAAG